MALDHRKASRMALYAGDIESLFGAMIRTLPMPPGGIPVLPDELKEPLALLRSSDWIVEGQLRCNDDLSMIQYLRQIFGTAENDFFYGYLLRRVTQDPHADFEVGDFLVLVRGTMEPIEWVLDLLAAPDLLNKIAHKIKGDVPSGFISIYESMTLTTPDGRSAGRAARAIGDIVNRDNRPVTVVGHSLGAAISVYLTEDLATEVADSPTLLDAYLIACPQPGTTDFAAAFRTAVGRYNVVNWQKDLVPNVPPLPYTALLNGSAVQNVERLSTSTPGLGPVPQDTPGENHNAVNYAVLLDPDNARATELVKWRGA